MLKKRVPYLILVLVLLVSSVAASENFIAGGYIGTDNQNFIQVLNPTSQEAVVDITLFFDKDQPESHEAKVGAFSTLSIDVSQFTTGSFAATVSSDSDIIVDDVQFDNTYSAGFGSQAVADPAFVWYFPEGYSSGMAKTYLYIFNPGTRASTVGVTLYYDSGEKKTFSEEVSAQHMLRIDLKERSMPEKRFGIKVTGTAPIVASSGYLNKRFSAGSGGHGSTELSDAWYFADGFVSDDTTEFLNLLNPSFEKASVDVTVYYTDGTTREFSETVPANGKRMVLMNNYAESNRWYSTVVESDVDIAASVSHFDDTYSAGHGGPGATAPADFMYFAYAVAGDSANSHVAVFNPSENDAGLELSFYYADGTVDTLEADAAALSRSNIDLNSLASGIPFGVSVASSVPVVAHMVVFGKAFSAGHGYVGIQTDEAVALEVSDTADEAGSDDVSDDTTSPLEPDYLLVKEETLGASKFKGEVSEGLDNVVKSTYDYSGSTVLLWRFAYLSDESASDAYDAVLSGGLMNMLEVSPSTISGTEVHDFVSSKSEGVAWKNGSYVYLFVSAKDDGLAEGLAVETVKAYDEEGMSLLSIILILAALIALVLIVRWLFRSTSEEDDWEDMIVSAAPEKLKTPEQKKRAAEKKEKKSRKIFRKKKSTKDSADKDKKAKPAPPAPKKKGRKKKAAKEEKKEDSPEPEKVEDVDGDVPSSDEAPAPKKSPAGRKSKFKNRPRPDISIKEKARPTAQDILDELEHIPDYEDVFRHVNRDNEEIKPK